MNRRNTARGLCLVVGMVACVWFLDRHEPRTSHRIESTTSPSQAARVRSPANHIELLEEPTVDDTATPAWASASERFVVVSPACGYFPRYLSLPERARIPIADQDAARDILEELRETVAQRFPRPDGADDEVLRSGAMAAISARWQQRDATARQKTLAALRDPSVRDDLADDLRWLQQRNDDTYKLLEALLAPSMSRSAFSELWQDDLAWCEAILPAEGG